MSLTRPGSVRAEKQELELWSSVAQTVGLHDVLTVGQKRLEFNEGTGLAQAEGRRGRDITRTTSARIATGRSPGRGLMVMASSTFHFRLPWERRRLRAGLGRNTCLHSVSPCLLDQKDDFRED
jgi:hypothetical protein